VEHPIRLALFVACALALAAGAVAVGQEPPPDPDETEPGAPVVRLPDENTWLDVTHEFVETRLFAPVLRFDRFFSDDLDLDEDRARSYLRWRTALRFDAEDHPALGTGLRANLRLPGLNALLGRMRLVVATEARQSLEALAPEDPAHRARRGGDAELRFDVLEALHTHGDLGAGVLFRLPPGAFARAGLRWRLALGESFLTRLALNGFWRTDLRFGTSASARVEQALGEHAVLRAGQELFLAQRSPDGLEWTPSLGLIVGLGRRSAVSMGASAAWRRDAAPRIERYVLAARFRRDVYRRWLFAEVEPEVYWPWSPALGRHAAMAVTLRLEVQFSGNESATQQQARAEG
jgi:hypothetical protein